MAEAVGLLRVGAHGQDQRIRPVLAGCDAAMGVRPGEPRTVGRIERQAFVIFRDQMERIPSSLKQEDCNLTLPELANKYGHRIEAIVAARPSGGNDARMSRRRMPA